MISALHKALWSSESVNVEIGDPYMSEMPLDSSAWAPSSTVKSYINSANKVSPYFNTKYYCAKKSQTKTSLKLCLISFYINVVNTILKIDAYRSLRCNYLSYFPRLGVVLNQ